MTQELLKKQRRLMQRTGKRQELLKRHDWTMIVKRVKKSWRFEIRNKNKNLLNCLSGFSKKIDAGTEAEKAIDFLTNNLKEKEKGG